MNVIFGTMDLCDRKIDLIKFMQVSDLVFYGPFILHYILKVSVIDLYYFDN